MLEELVGCRPIPNRWTHKHLRKLLQATDILDLACPEVEAASRVLDNRLRHPKLLALCTFRRERRAAAEQLPDALGIDNPWVRDYAGF